jgi:1-acyl-sn-glycerol-3-phosphate acyltransferase
MRTLIVAVSGVISTLFFGSIAFITGFFNPYSKLINSCARYWAKTILLSAGTRLEITGLENIDSTKNYVIMANHQSQFDILALYSIIPLTARFIAKKELYKVPVFGWILSTTGMIKIDRSNREKAIQSLNDALATIKRERVSLIVFPEGTRSLDGNIHNFKKGGFIIAIKGKIPIIPVSISGSLNISKKNSFKISRGRIKVFIDQPLMIKNYTYNQRQELINTTRQIIIKNFIKDYQ